MLYFLNAVKRCTNVNEHTRPQVAIEHDDESKENSNEQLGDF